MRDSLARAMQRWRWPNDGQRCFPCLCDKRPAMPADFKDAAGAIVTKVASSGLDIRPTQAAAVDLRLSARP
jgi:hypothetical protein